MSATRSSNRSPRQMLAGVMALGVVVLAATAAQAGTITVNATDNIYGAGQTAAPGGGTLPGFIALGTGTSYVTFSSVVGSIACSVSSEGCITLNNYGNLNDPDGAGAAVSSSSNTGAGSLSGITDPGAGYLVGVFVAAGGPSGTAPTATSASTSAVNMSPSIDQVFFIGDGLTGDGSGTTQQFYVPTGATMLYLGISDACSYNGSPSCYSDNVGTYTATYALTARVAAVPEPASMALLGAGLFGLGAIRRRARR